MRFRQLWGVALVVLLGAASSGCGEDEGQSTARDAKPPGEAEIVAMFDRWQAEFMAGRGEKVCAKLSRAGRAELEQLSSVIPAVKPGATCPEAVRAVIGATRDAGTVQRPAKAVSAKIDGRRATVMVSDAGHPPTPIGLVREDGEWKLDTAGFSGLVGNK